jgi:hypothetical protein
VQSDAIRLRAGARLVLLQHQLEVRARARALGAVS